MILLKHDLKNQTTLVYSQFLVCANRTEPVLYCILDVFLFMQFIHNRVHYFLSKLVPFDTFSHYYYYVFVFCALISAFYRLSRTCHCCSQNKETKVNRISSHFVSIVPVILITLIMTLESMNSKKK